MIHIYYPYYEQWFDNSRTRDDHGLSDIFVDHMKEMNDPRLAVIAHPAIESVWKGIHDEQPYRMPYPENQEKGYSQFECPLHQQVTWLQRLMDKNGLKHCNAETLDETEAEICSIRSSCLHLHRIRIPKRKYERENSNCDGCYLWNRL